LEKKIWKSSRQEYGPRERKNGFGKGNAAAERSENGSVRRKRGPREKENRLVMREGDR
jgi:hypothetical protein